MSDKLKFETVGQFLVALEEGPLYDENCIRYVLEGVPTKVDALAVVEYSLENRCIRCNTGLLSAQENSIAHTFTRSRPTQDKDLVWCWDNHYKTCRSVYFYDAKNMRVFDVHGNRNGTAYSNYQIIEPNKQGLYEHPFDWANEAKKKLAK